MRRDDALLLDMLIAARKVERFVRDLTAEQFSESELVQSAVIRELQVIGEAARLITDETRAATSQVDWRAITGMRNRLVHQYFAIRLDVVWETVHQSIPVLIAQLESLVPKDPD